LPLDAYAPAAVAAAGVACPQAKDFLMTDNAFPLFKSPEGEARFMAAYDDVLKQWPVPFDQLDIPTRLGMTHVIASGPAGAPALVLLHSMAGTATLWRPNVAAFSQHFRVYVVDVPGQVGGSVLTRKIESREEMAGWFADLLDGLGHRTASIVGSSFGGFLAMSQAQLTPDRIDRVVMISPIGTFVPISFKFIYGMLVKPLIRKLTGQKPPPADITRLLGRGQTLPSEHEAWGRLMSITMAESVRPSLARVKVFKPAELAAIPAPALLLIGEQENIYDAHITLVRAKQRMPRLHTAAIPNAHHLAALAQPADVNARILTFLRDR
jgi:pimeloyl-ACP methyl ester carboxylesterase